MLCQLSYGHHNLVRIIPYSGGNAKIELSEQYPHQVNAPQPTNQARLDRLRYLRVVRFFAGAFLSVIWWDLILRRVPGLRDVSKRSSLERWRRIARRFRALAVHMGGVFMSPTRNLANTSRSKRHVNPWNYPVHVHTYEEYENEFREKMKGAGLPVEKE